MQPLEEIFISLSSYVVLAILPDSQYGNGGISEKTEEGTVMFAHLVASLCEYVGMDIDEMYSLYMKKNELNHERVDGGYMEGKYEKVDSEGREDNEKLFKD
jgi:hypothetical protein